MEKRINLKTRKYLQQLKEEIKENIITLFPNQINSSESNAYQLLQFVYDYQPLVFEKEDFQKRKRIKKLLAVGKADA